MSFIYLFSIIIAMIILSNLSFSPKHYDSGDNDFHVAFPPSSRPLLLCNAAVRYSAVFCGHERTGLLHPLNSSGACAMKAGQLPPEQVELNIDNLHGLNIPEPGKGQFTPLIQAAETDTCSLVNGVRSRELETFCTRCKEVFVINHWVR